MSAPPAAAAAADQIKVWFSFSVKTSKRIPSKKLAKDYLFYEHAEQDRLQTLAAGGDVGVSLVTCGAVAEVAAAVPGVDALAVVADAHVRRGVPLGLPARLPTDHPVQQQRHLAAGGRHEVAGGDVGCPEVERGGLHEHGVAAGAEARDGRGVEAVVELHPVGVDAPGDGRLAAAHAGAGAVHQRPGVRARRHASRHVDGPRVDGLHVRQRVAAHDDEAVALVGEPELRVGQVRPPQAVVAHGPRGAVVAPGLDVVADARLAAAHVDVGDLDGLVVVAAARGEPAGELEGDVALARVVVAPAPDAERVRDLQVAAPPLAGVVAVWCW